jgi:hypothetical protein
MTSRAFRNLIDDINIGRASSATSRTQIDQMLNDFARNQIDIAPRTIDVNLQGQTRRLTFEFAKNKDGRPIVKFQGEEFTPGQLFQELRIVTFIGNPKLNIEKIDAFTNALRKSIEEKIPTAEGRNIAETYANLYKQQLLDGKSFQEIARIQKANEIANANSPGRSQKGSPETKEIDLDNQAEAKNNIDEIKNEETVESQFLDENGQTELIEQITVDAQAAGVDTMTFLQRRLKDNPQAIARLEKIKNSWLYRNKNNLSVLGTVGGAITGLALSLDKKALRDEAINRQKETNGCFLINLITNEKTKISLLTCGDFDTGKVIQTCATQLYTSGATINECPTSTFNPCTINSKSRSSDPAVPLVPNVCDKYLYKGTAPSPVEGVTTLTACPDTVSSPCSGYCKSANFNLPENFELQCIDVDYMTIYLNLVEEIGYDANTLFPPKIASSTPAKALIIATAVLGTVFLLVAVYYYFYRVK